MLSAPNGCLLTVCRAFANPPALPGKNQPQDIIKLQEITPLSPFDWCNFPSSTGKGYLGLFKRVLYCLWNCHYLYRLYIFPRAGITGFCRFFSEAIQEKTSLPPSTMASSTSKRWTIDRKDYLSILIMHCRFYIHFRAYVCVTFWECCRECFKCQRRKVVMLNSYGSVGVNRKKD